MRTLVMKRRGRSESGSAVILVMTMVGILVILLAVNHSTLKSLEKELKLIETKQMQRIQPSPAPSPNVAVKPH